MLTCKALARLGVAIYKTLIQVFPLLPPYTRAASGATPTPTSYCFSQGRFLRTLRACYTNHGLSDIMAAMLRRHFRC